MAPVSLSKLTDEGLLEALRRTCSEGKKNLAQQIVLLIWVDERRLHLAAAYPSLFEFCRTECQMSEGEAFRRIAAARLVKQFPQLLERIERGEIHLSALVQLRNHFTEQNVDALVDAARGKNKMQVAELVVRMAPRPDVPAKLRKLPHHDRSSRVTDERRPSIEPLSEARYRLQLTGSREFRDKLLRLRDLMMHTNPHGDLGVVVERAVDELLEKFEKKIFGKTSRDAARSSGPPEAMGVATPRKRERAGRRAELPGLARTTIPPDAQRDQPRAKARKAASTSARASSAMTTPLKRVAASARIPVVARSG